MKMMMTLMILVLMSCGSMLPLSEQTTVAKEGIDTIVDIESRFGEPLRFYKAGSQYVAKYENILESEIVYLKFRYVKTSSNLLRAKRKKVTSTLYPDKRDNFKQNWVLYKIDRRPNKHS